MCRCVQKGRKGDKNFPSKKAASVSKSPASEAPSKVIWFQSSLGKPPGGRWAVFFFLWLKLSSFFSGGKWKNGEEI